jgi:hypothetical protein
MERRFKTNIYNIFSALFLLISIFAFSETVAQNSQKFSGLASAEGGLLIGSSTRGNKINYQNPDVTIYAFEWSKWRTF